MTGHVSRHGFQDLFRIPVDACVILPSSIVRNCDEDQIFFFSFAMLVARGSFLGPGIEPVL